MAHASHRRRKDVTSSSDAGKAFLTLESTVSVSVSGRFYHRRKYKINDTGTSSKYGMSDGTATEPVWTTQTRTEYARRMHVVRTILYIAIARTTANTLLHGANTLLVTGHTF